MPMLRAYASMHPRLHARDLLARAAVVSLGSGHLSKKDAGDLRREWERAAELRRRVVKATPQDLASMGIRVTQVPKEGS